MKLCAALLVCALVLGGCGSYCELVACPNRTDISFSYCHTKNDGCFFRGGADKFQCSSCNECSGAHAGVLTWCGQQPRVSNPVAGESCQVGSCGTAGRGYQFCATPEATSCRYVADDGTQFACLSCSDCTTAAGRIGAWCRGVTPPPPDLAVPLKKIGEECATDSDCRQGTKPTCLKLGAAARGTCSSDCSDDTDCGDLAACVDDGADGICARKCEAPADCPGGLLCYVSIPASATVCYPPLSILDCDPKVASCTLGGKAGGCERLALGTGKTGRCRERCVIGTNTCPAASGATQGCYAVDDTKDENGQPDGDTLRGTFCMYRNSIIADGAECLDNGEHFADDCADGSQCDVTTFNPAGDNKCHKLCYLGNFTPSDPVPVGGMRAGPCVNSTCTDVFGLAGSSAPVGLCK